MALAKVWAPPCDGSQEAFLRPYQVYRRFEGRPSSTPPAPRPTRKAKREFTDGNLDAATHLFDHQGKKGKYYTIS